MNLNAGKKMLNLGAVPTLFAQVERGTAPDDITIKPIHPDAITFQFAPTSVGPWTTTDIPDEWMRYRIGNAEEWSAPQLTSAPS